MKTSNRTFRMPADVLEKLRELREKKFLGNDNNAVIFAIVEAHRQMTEPPQAPIPVPVIFERTGSGNTILGRPRIPIEEKVAREEEKKQAKIEAMNAKGRSICELLDGNEIKNPNGTFGCEYTLYEKVGNRVLTGKRIVPFDLLTDEHVALQYKGGTKEEVQALVEK